MPAAMTALTDIQRALNAIRKLERDASVDTKIDALALVASTAADMARGLRAVEQPPRKRAADKSVPRKPVPKPLPIPKPTAPPNTSAPSDLLQPRPEPKPFTEPEL